MTSVYVCMCVCMVGGERCVRGTDFSGGTAHLLDGNYDRYVPSVLNDAGDGG